LNRSAIVCTQTSIKPRTLWLKVPAGKDGVAVAIGDVRVAVLRETWGSTTGKVHHVGVDHERALAGAGGRAALILSGGEAKEAGGCDDQGGELEERHYDLACACDKG
jgi:hypothetical protein